MEIIFVPPFQTGPASLPRADLMDKWAEAPVSKAVLEGQCLLCKRAIELGEDIRTFIEGNKKGKNWFSTRKHKTHNDCFEHYSR